MAALEATNATLSSRVAELKVELKLKDKEIRQLKEQQTGSLERIQEVIGNCRNMVRYKYSLKVLKGDRSTS